MNTSKPQRKRQNSLSGRLKERSGRLWLVIVWTLSAVLLGLFIMTLLRSEAPVDRYETLGTRCHTGHRAAPRPGQMMRYYYHVDGREYSIDRCASGGMIADRINYNRMNPESAEIRSVASNAAFYGGLGTFVAILAVLLTVYALKHPREFKL